MARHVLHNLLVLDIKIFDKIYNLNGRKRLDWFIYKMSRLGDGYAYAVLGILILLFDFHIARQLIPAGLIAFTFDLTVYTIMKRKIKRIRPFEYNSEIKSLIRPPDKFSFPSGHTAGAFLVAVILGHFYPPLMLSTLFLASLVGFSRVYNGVHFPGDVIAGMALGITSAKIGLAIIF